MGESEIVRTDGSSVNLAMLQIFWVVLFFGLVVLVIGLMAISTGELYY
jgi:hypothetical protein